MTICLKVKKEQAQKLKEKLIALNLFNNSMAIEQESDYVYLPLKAEPKQNLGPIVKRKPPKLERHAKSLKEILQGKLTNEEIKFLRTSYDLLGEIALIEIPPELEPKEKTIGNALLELYSSLRAVFKKTGPVCGTYRVRKVKKIAGTGSSKTTYKENNCTYKFDISKVFFSSRMSTERLIVAKQVKAGEVILDMFAGVGPFAILIAKFQPEVKIYALDINPDAILYLKENAELNKVSEKIESFEGDASKLIDKFKGKADRVIMNLPRTEKNYLPLALKALKPQGIINYYTFGSDEEEVIEKTRKNLKAKSYKILGTRKVKPYAPNEWNFAVDIYISEK